MKIEIFKIKKSFKKGGFNINPNISWELILCLVFVMIVASFIFGFFLFSRVNQEFIVPAISNSGQIPKIDKEQIEKVLNYFSEREKNSARIINSPIPFIDPSL